MVGGGSTRSLRTFLSYMARILWYSLVQLSLGLEHPDQLKDFVPLFNVIVLRDVDIVVDCGE